ncbi:MAG TPA: SDR family oxidoreductase [Candidatus Kapabacteria bacterium]|nr:SDR family oxidoreductase [Candidatus Kapabacteria bacterium]
MTEHMGNGTAHVENGTADGNPIVVRGAGDRRQHALPSPGSLFSLAGKVAIVTGGVGLIGRRHCEALLGAGASVIVTDLNEAECQTFAEELRSKLGDDQAERAIGIGADITDPHAVGHLLEQTLAIHGRVDVLVNNAAINDMVESPASGADLSRFENYPLEMFRRSLDVNVTGTFLCSQIVGSEMARCGSGSIINVASTYGVVAPDQSLYRRADGTQTFYKSAVYPVTKGAVISFTRFLAAYWGTAGVRVNTLSPGGVENAQDEQFIHEYERRTPLGRMASSGDYQGALLFLASDASSYMTGANLIVDGGWTCW